MARMWVQYASSFSTSLKMMFSNAGVIYKALGIPVNSFTVTITLESTPTDATHWSTRDLAKRIGVSQSTVSRIWRAFNLQPHRVETFRLSNDPLLVEKVRDIVSLYMNPPNHAVVLCVDEKSQIQAYWSGRSLFCRCDRVSPSVVPTTTCGTGRPRSLQRST